MSDAFDGPGSAAGIQWQDLLDKLLLITPLEATVVQTSYGESAAVRANIAVIDGDNTEDITDTLIFPRMLQSQVRGNVGTGRMNLGRLTQGTAKPGQSKPWLLADPTDDDKTAARSHLARKDAAPF